MEPLGLVQREPAAELRGLVTEYYGDREETGSPMRRREGPGDGVVVILGFDTSWWIGDALDPGAPGGRYSAIAGGMREGQVLTEHEGASHGLQVDMSPYAARALFRIPAARRELVDDVDAHYARAKEAGAPLEAEPEDRPYGDRSYRTTDPEGHRWFIAQHVRDVPVEEWSG